MPSETDADVYVPRTLQEMLALEGADGTGRHLRQYFIDDDLYGAHNRALEPPPCTVRLLCAPAQAPACTY